MDQFEKEFLSRYEMRKMGNAEHFLGVRIIRDRPQRKLWLVQDSYIDKLAEKFNITANKVPKTPLPSAELIPFDRIATPQQIHGYQQRVGSINFSIVITRLDVSKLVCDETKAKVAYMLDCMLAYVLDCMLACMLDSHVRMCTSLCFLCYTKRRASIRVDNATCNLLFFSLFFSP